MEETRQLGGYRLLRRLAVSNMSEVYLATAGPGGATGTPVVLKVLIEEAANVEALVELFRHEAALASIMTHPNVVRFLGAGEAEGRPFLVMEHVEGMDLWRLTRRLRRAGRSLPAAQAVFILAEVLEALSYVHALVDESGKPLEIIHHDVSPSNILLGMHSEVKLGDFGIAYSEQQNLSRIGRKFKGKVYYLSPEQVRGETVDHRSDLYSAGIVLFELLVGKRPFAGPTDLSILINVRDRISSVLREGLDSLPIEIARIIDRALASDPAGRYPDAASFRADLVRAVDPHLLERAPLDLPDTVKSMARPHDAVTLPRPDPHINIYRAFATPKADDLPPSPELEEEQIPTPVTPVRDVCEYILRKSDGQPVGALPLAEIIEGIVSERIIEDDLVSVNGEPFTPVAHIPDLAKHLASSTRTDRRHDLGPPDRRGLISRLSVAGILLDMYRRKETGLVIFDCHEIRKDVFLEGGVPRYISSNVASELLGEFLVRIGSISRLELDMALAVMDRFDGHLGDTLLGLDIMDPISLLRDITRQIKARFYDLFAWETGEYQFYRRAEPLKKEFRLSVGALDLVKEGCLAALETEDMEAWFDEHRDAAISIDAAAGIPLAEWKFPPSYDMLLGGLDTPRTLDAIMAPYSHASKDIRAKVLRVIRFCTIVGLIAGIERTSLTQIPS